MLKFKEFQPEKLLLEALLTFPRGARPKYNNVVFITGATASGKGFSSQNMLDLSGYRKFDVDELKFSIQAISKRGKYKMADYRDKVVAELPTDVAKEYDKCVREGKIFADLKMGNPKHVYILHIMQQVLGLNTKLLSYLEGANSGSKNLPNIAFDITGKEGAIQKYLPMLHNMGYDPSRIHMVWILIDAVEAQTNNLGRERVVPQDLLKKYHKVVKDNMQKVIKQNIIKEIQGEIYVILNKRKNTKFWGDDFKHVKSFEYIWLKSKGKFVNNAVFEKFDEWIKYIKKMG